MNLLFVYISCRMSFNHIMQASSSLQTQNTNPNKNSKVVLLSLHTHGYMYVQKRLQIEMWNKAQKETEDLKRTNANMHLRRCLQSILLVGCCLEDVLLMVAWESWWFRESTNFFLGYKPPQKQTEINIKENLPHQFLHPIGITYEISK